MELLEIVFVVLMLLWLFIGGYWYYDPARPQVLGGHFIAWCCVAILGWRVFGGR